MLLRQVFQACDVLLEGRVIDQDVELAELLEGLLDRGFTEAQIRDVPRHRNTTSPFGLDRAFGLLGVGVLVQIRDCHVRAFAGVEYRDRTADTGIAPCNQRHHVAQFVGAVVVGCIVHGSTGELGFQAGLFEVLFGKGCWISTGAGLHRSRFLCFAACCCLISAIDLPLNRLLAAGGFFGILGEGLQSTWIAHDARSD